MDPGQQLVADAAAATQLARGFLMRGLPMEVVYERLSMPPDGILDSDETLSLMGYSRGSARDAVSRHPGSPSTRKSGGGDVVGNRLGVGRLRSARSKTPGLPRVGPAAVHRPESIVDDEAERMPVESWTGEVRPCSIFFGPWHQMRSFCAHDNLESADRDLIDLAFDVLQTNDYLIVRFEDSDGVRVDTSCIQSLIWGGDSLYGRLHIREDDISNRGYTIPGSTTITLKRSLLNAMVNRVNQPTCSSRCQDCIVSELAGLILHEAAHNCLLGEPYAYVLGHYWRYYYQERVRTMSLGSGAGMGSRSLSVVTPGVSLCCAQAALSTWDTSTWSTCAVASASTRMDVASSTLVCGTSVC